MSLFQRFRSPLTRRVPPPLTAPTHHTLEALLQLELTRELARLQSEARAVTPDNPAARGFKVYSQTDEDGIIEEICLRLHLQNGFFIEIGCGDGRENNTHYLLLKGWRGVWVDGDPANIAAIRAVLPNSERLRVLEQMVTRDNVVSLMDAAGGSRNNVDLLSVDVDGNDLALVRTAVAARTPKIVVCEYNAKFPYPLIAEVAYDPNHRWATDDYHGASLAAYVQALQPGYRLVSCNLAGTNAFFVRDDLAGAFERYPPERLYQPARFHLTALRSGHTPSLSFLRNALAR